MAKLVEVVDEDGLPTMIPFHRVIRVVKGTSNIGHEAVVFLLDGGATVCIKTSSQDAERAWAMYREWVQSVV